MSTTSWCSFYKVNNKLNDTFTYTELATIYKSTTRLSFSLYKMNIRFKERFEIQVIGRSSLYWYRQYWRFCLIIILNLLKTIKITKNMLRLLAIISLCLLKDWLSSQSWYVCWNNWLSFDPISGEILYDNSGIHLWRKWVKSWFKFVHMAFNLLHQK